MTCTFCENEDENTQAECRGYRVYQIDTCLCGQCDTIISAIPPDQTGMARMSVPHALWQRATRCFTESADGSVGLEAIYAAVAIINHPPKGCVNTVDVRGIVMQTGGRA